MDYPPHRGVLWPVMIEEPLVLGLSKDFEEIQVRCIYRRIGGRAHGELCGEELWMPGDPDQVGVAGDDPEPVLLVPVDRVFLPQTAKVGVGIVDHFTGKQVIVNSSQHTPSTP